MRNDIFEGMNVLRQSMAAEIEEAFASDVDGVTSKGHAITTMCLSASVTFVTQMCNYVDALFEKLHSCILEVHCRVRMESYNASP